MRSEQLSLNEDAMARLELMKLGGLTAHRFVQIRGGTWMMSASFGDKSYSSYHMFPSDCVEEMFKWWMTLNGDTRD